MLCWLLGQCVYVLGLEQRVESGAELAASCRAARSLCPAEQSFVLRIDQLDSRSSSIPSPSAALFAVS